ncbi:hypothetical protein X962_1702 [Burkholderia pseudomallei MSHR7343]|uniref:hypothetical protein n=1 Tax=Burkholderia pseudomallei TaxID=28450 RepID=UPI000531094C|nr:hypothetical protein [Burkholderia pseudomallei]KGS36154.1 hypothetical protein X962_1702 [Burkholderia pseudomallei MSHR7343]
MFEDVVALYRALNRPTLTPGYSYAFEGVLDARTRQLAERCENLDAAFGSVDVLDEGGGRFRIDVHCRLPQKVKSSDQSRKQTPGATGRLLLM